MIRERRQQDLDPLCAVLEALETSSGLLPGRDPRAWLQEHDAELSWVFDMAPVSVAPTKNVVGHVQIYAPVDDSSTHDVVEHTGVPTSDLLVIGKLFVKPDTYEHGIGRFLVKESVNHIRDRGKVPVLDHPGTGMLTRGFCEKLGFEEVPSGTPGTPMIYTR